VKDGGASLPGTCDMISEEFPNKNSPTKKRRKNLCEEIV